VAKVIIEALEVVQVEHDNADGLLAARRPMDLPFERFFQVASVEQASHGVTDRPLPQGLAQSQVCQRQCNAVGHGPGQLLLHERHMQVCRVWQLVCALDRVLLQRRR